MDGRETAVVGVVGVRVGGAVTAGAEAHREAMVVDTQQLMEGSARPVYGCETGVNCRPLSTNPAVAPASSMKKPTVTP